ncbi:MAG: Short-chain dehydrogenase, associated with 2-hydroxychromene-2-carboxylate isomerase family protein, partial [uncultured Gemmatimonadaceae bacterium]
GTAQRERGRGGGGRPHRRGHRPAVRRRGLHGVLRPAERREAPAAGRRDRGSGRRLRRPLARRAAGGAGGAVPGGRRRGGAAGGRGVQHRRQRELPAARHDGAGVPQGLGAGLPCRLPHRAGGGAGAAAARARLHLPDRRHRERARRRGLRRLRQRQVRPARRRAEHGARAGAAEHPCGAPGDRRRRRHRVGAGTDRRAHRDRSLRSRAAGARPAAQPGHHRGDLLAAPPAAARRLDARARHPPFPRDLV